MSQKNGFDVLLVLSNAGPVKYTQLDGKIITTLSAGGLVSAIRGIEHLLPSGFIWIQAPSTNVEFAMAAGLIPQPPFAGNIRVVLAPMNALQHDALYTSVTNGVLWHCAHSSPELALPMLEQMLPQWDETWDLFVQASEAMVEAALKEVLNTPPGTKFAILIEDYQMILVASLLRRQLEEYGRAADVSMQMHWHIVWAEGKHWNVLPESARIEIARGMLGVDTLCFHTRRDAHNFTLCAALWLPGEVAVHTTPEGFVVKYEGRTTELIVNPIGIDTREMAARLASPDGRKAVKAIGQKIAGREYVFAGIGRTDPAKQLDILVEAFAIWLREHPDKVARSVLLLHQTESRQSNDPNNAYKLHKDRVEGRIATINAQFRKQAQGRDVIEAYYASDPHLHLGLYAQYDVLVVPSKADGFALVATEGPWLNRKNGVLVLSTGTGAHELLSDGVLPFVPGEDEVSQLTRLLDQAIAMPEKERRRRQSVLRNAISTHDLAAWLEVRFQHIAKVLAQKASNKS